MGRHCQPVTVNTWVEFVRRQRFCNVNCRNGLHNARRSNRPYYVLAAVRDIERSLKR